MARSAFLLLALPWLAGCGAGFEKSKPIAVVRGGDEPALILEDTLKLEEPPAPVSGEPPAPVSGEPPAPVSGDSAAAVSDSAGALAQTLLLLPFRDYSKFEGPWDIYTEVPRSLADTLRRNKFFRVVPLDKVLPRLKEKELKGHIDVRKALRLARELGADMVVVGEIHDLSMKRFRATVPLGGFRSFQGVVDFKLKVLKVIDGRSAGVVKAHVVRDQDTRKVNITNPAVQVPLEKEYFFLGQNPWGSDAFRQTLVGLSVQEALHKVSLGMGKLIHHPPLLQMATAKPKIIDIVGSQAYINVGIADSVQNGDKFGVWDNGRELFDPTTRAALGRALPRRVGVVQVKQVLNEHLSLGKILEEEAKIQKGYDIRAE